MRTIGNVLWLLLAGLWMAAGYLAAALVLLVPIVTIPFSLQALKLAGLSLWPFGRAVVQGPGTSPALGFVGNVLWLVFGGLWLAVGHFLTGVLLCVTVIGIPFGIASFKLAVLALAPFGMEIVPAGEAQLMSARTVASF